MSFSLFVAVLVLIVIFVALATGAQHLQLIHFTKWATRYQLAQVEAMLDEDDDFDERYEQNRQIINPIGDNPFEN